MEHREQNGIRKFLTHIVMILLGALVSLVLWVYLVGQDAQATVNQRTDTRISNLESNMNEIKTTLSRIDERMKWLDKLKR